MRGSDFCEIGEGSKLCKVIYGQPKSVNIVLRMRAEDRNIQRRIHNVNHEVTCSITNRGMKNEG